MGVTVFTSAASRHRIALGRDWLDARRPAEEVLIIGATLGAANELARSLAQAKRASFGYHRLTLGQLASVLARPALTTQRSSQSEGAVTIQQVGAFAGPDIDDVTDSASGRPGGRLLHRSPICQEASRRPMHISGTPHTTKSGSLWRRSDEAEYEDKGKPKITYAVQLALYLDVLKRMGYPNGRKAFIWDIHGQEVTYDFTKPRWPRTPETLWDSAPEA